MKSRKVTANESVINESSPLSSEGFSKEFIDAVYRRYNIKHDAEPIKATSKPKASDLKRYVFVSRTTSGKAFAAGTNSNSQWRRGAPYAHLIIDNNGKLEQTNLPASNAINQIAKGSYYAIPFDSTYDRTRDQSSTKYKRENPVNTHDTEYYQYCNRVEEVFGDRIRAEMSKVANYAFDNLRKFSSEDGSRISGNNDQARALQIANELEALSKKPLNTGFQGSWSNKSMFEKYLQHLGMLANGWGSIPNNQRRFKEVMDTTPNGLAKYAKFILSTVHAYKSTLDKMLSKEVTGESIVKEDGGTCSGGIAAGPATNLFAKPIKRSKKMKEDSAITPASNPGGQRSMSPLTQVRRPNFGSKEAELKEMLARELDRAEIIGESGYVYDPITKKNVPRKSIKQAAGGPVTKNGVPFSPKKKEKPFRDAAATGNPRDFANEGIGDTVKKGVKSVKRGMQGWAISDFADLSGKDPGPKGIRKRNMNYDDATTNMLHQHMSGVDTSKHGPAALQKRVLDREVAKRKNRTGSQVPGSNGPLDEAGPVRVRSAPGADEWTINNLQQTYGNKFVNTDKVNAAKAEKDKARHAESRAGKMEELREEPIEESAAFEAILHSDLGVGDPDHFTSYKRGYSMIDGVRVAAVKCGVYTGIDTIEHLGYDPEDGEPRQMEEIIYYWVYRDPKNPKQLITRIG